jgi:fumarylacetoacetase
MSHADTRRSWIASANGHPDFPLQNLPLGIFSPAGGTPRGGVAIGEQIFDLKLATSAGLFDGAAATAAEAASADSLNAFFALGAGPRRALREQLQTLLAEGSAAQARLQALGADLLPAQADCQMHLPARVGDYTDFYVGIHHANNVGRLFRPDNPLLPNYKHVPIGYHGRASSIGVDQRFPRPVGQQRPAAEGQPPEFGPCKRLDYELELGIFVGTGNPQGNRIPIEEAEAHVFGLCLFNDWSARDLQAWEYQPLGPFLAKNFASTISPWIVTYEALAPFREQFTRPVDDPQPLPYLSSAANSNEGALNVQMKVLLTTEQSRAKGAAPALLSSSNFRDSYWTIGQLIAHHTVNGCNLQPGDMFGSGTMSGPSPSEAGSLLELTEGGKKPLELPWGEKRTFLQDGDQVIFRGECVKAGYPHIGFGECVGTVLPAR